MIKPINGEQWYCCPHCGQKHCKVSSAANSSGVFPKCKKCGKEFEIKI